MKSLLLLSLPLALVEGAQKPINDGAWALPRGVNPSLTDKYRPNSKSQFTCLSSGTKIPYSLVNDDFCDCPDGSDEPGTAACSHLNHSVNPLPGFFCANKGHVPAYIPFSRINDGICDYDVCCDGSDEWMGVGGVKCTDKCEIIGKEARKAAAEAKALYESGVRSFRNLIAKAALLKKEAEDKTIALKGEIVRAEALVEERKKTLKEAEVEEKSRLAASGGDAGPAGSKHQQLLKFAQDRLQEYKENLRTLQAQKETLEYQLESAEKILSTFKDEYNPNFNDEGVKRAVKSWEDYLSMKPVKDENEADFKADVETLMHEEVNWDDWQPEPDPIVEDMYAIESLLPPFLRSWAHSQLNGLRDTLVENGLLAPRKPPSSSSSGSSNTPALSPHLQKLTDDLANAEQALNTKRSDLTNLETDVSKDYGPQGVFRSIKDGCVEAESGEYTYSFCHMARATQKNRDGSSTHLGDWTGFEKRFDEEIEKDVLVVKYERGMRCWNGPERSAYVYLRCSAEEKLLTVAETEKCVYKYVATSPAACGEADAAAGELPSQEEGWPGSS
ncbi:hypothetical protein H072_10613 [Dactylellina haptotyla CBS 200.50]|uniref:Glucosidase 2 subunit beta n=1 Tax=Dactylellina haptotyla (strain CBS 200.50) TaxID=1284197 RepID=S7ZZ00_DACHA|nr:hypothetical protein H072_10613 [Dactylellina haptotyla CBS 200.50]